MEIGNPRRTIVIEPLDIPIPKKREVPMPEVTPEREPVLVPA